MQAFGHVKPTRTDLPLMEFQGTLVRCAEARTKPLDETGMAVPVLCMDIELSNGLHSHMHVEQPFAPNQFELVHARAKALKKGAEVTVHVSLIDIHLVARNASLVTPTATDKAVPTTPTTPTTPNPQEPELWQA